MLCVSIMSLLMRIPDAGVDVENKRESETDGMLINSILLMHSINGVTEH